MDLWRFLSAARKRWRTVVAGILAGVAAGALLTIVTTPTYMSSTKVFFAVQSGSSSTDLAQGSTFAEKQVRSYQYVAKSPLVLEPVIARLGLNMPSQQLAEQITASVPLNTVIVDLTVTDEDPVQAARIANALADQLSVTVGQISPENQGAQTVKATTMADAVPSAEPSAPNAKRNIALGLAVGLIAGIAVALLRETWDTLVRTKDDVAEVTDAPVIGAITSGTSATTIETDQHSLRAEAYRRLRTNLRFLDLGTDRNSIVFTSCIPGEGKSTTVINLASILADSGQRVLVIDGDLRRPTIAGKLGLEGNAGLTTVLIGRADLEDVVQPWGSHSLDILASGEVPPNPSEMLGSTQMQALLEYAQGQYDVVLIDTPPLLPVTDAALLTKFTSGAVVVVGYGETHRNQLRAALESIDAIGGHVLGTVLNKVQETGDSPIYTYHYRQAEPELPRRHANTVVEEPAPERAMASHRY